jgi:hypothetical protein
MSYNDYSRDLLKVFGEGFRYFSREMYLLDWGKIKDDLISIASDLDKMTNNLSFEFDSDDCEIYISNNNLVWLAVRLTRQDYIKSQKFVPEDERVTYALCLSKNLQEMYLEDSTTLYSTSTDCKLYKWLEHIQSEVKK